MLETKSVSVMKSTQDLMNNPPSDATIAVLVQRAKDVGATHLALSQPFGLPNTVSEIQRWVTEIRKQGMLVTWRLDDPSKHPMYNQPIFVDGQALSTATYHTRVDTFIRANPGLFADNDEWAIYYEPTSYWSGDGKIVNWFNTALSWLEPNSPSNFSDFFIGLANASQAAFDAIGKHVKVGLTATNGSEYLNKYIEQRLVDRVGYICTDHYVDNNPSQLETDLRQMKMNYGHPVYLQETAPDRNATPNGQQITDYFAALTRLVNDGVLIRYSYWGLWSGGHEGLLNPDLTLNAIGLGLQAFFGAHQTPIPPVPIPPVPPVPPPVDLTPRIAALETSVAVINAKLTAIKNVL